MNSDAQKATWTLQDSWQLWSRQLLPVRVHLQKNELEDSEYQLSFLFWFLDTCATYSMRGVQEYVQMAHCWGAAGSVHPESSVHVAGYMSDPFPAGATLCQCCPLSPALFTVFMDRISRCSQVAKGVRCENFRIPALLFADGVVSSAS